MTESLNTQVGDELLESRCARQDHPLGTSGKACLQKDVSGAVKSAHPQAHKPDQGK